MTRQLLLSIALLPSLGLRAQEAGYCEPVVDVANSDGSGITYVHLNGIIEIDRTSSVGEGYTMAGDSAHLLVGGYYTLTIERSSGWSCADNNLRAYIDFNGDGAFSETTETVALLSNGGDGAETFNFVVPGNAHEGHTRLRICEKHVQSCGQVAINSCGIGDSLGYRGEVEDYLVVIAGHVGVPEAGAPDVRIRAIDQRVEVNLAGPASPGDRIELFDATGKLLAARELYGGASSTVHLPVERQAFGIVVARATLATGTYVERLVLR